MQNKVKKVKQEDDFTIFSHHDSVSMVDDNDVM